MSDSNISPKGKSHNYLVLVAEILVAQDIALTIGDFDPAAQVIIANTTAEAEKAVSAVSGLDMVFATERPSQFVGSPLAAAIGRLGARVVLLGIEAEASGPTPFFDVLPQPFDTDAVLARLAQR